MHLSTRHQDLIWGANVMIPDYAAEFVLFLFVVFFFKAHACTPCKVDDFRLTKQPDKIRLRVLTRVKPGNITSRV